MATALRSSSKLPFELLSNLRELMRELFMVFSLFLLLVLLLLLDDELLLWFKFDLEDA